MVAKYQDLVRSQVDSHQVNLQIPSRRLDYSNIRVYRVVRENKTRISATVPITGTSESPLSAFTVVYNDSKIDNYAEVHISRNVRGNFQITTLSNGKKVADKDTGIAWRSYDEVLKEMHQRAAVIGTTGVGEKAGCLGVVLGVNSLIAYLIAGTCSAACETAITNPGSASVCAACVGGIAIVGAGDLSAVISCFKL